MKTEKTDFLSVLSVKIRSQFGYVKNWLRIKTETTDFLSVLSVEVRSQFGYVKNSYGVRRRERIFYQSCPSKSVANSHFFGGDT
ncbi:protein of unknown function [Candidatus Promineifilum breve]|uniref:Uncharacterized protein n=1 Tax=Candidatus Promineifilum breve TaxID=1806508 RepID=A0A161KD15_9CHLR|nr:protein of unknown function [Candidatus Promineifilum breve]